MTLASLKQYNKAKNEARRHNYWQIVEDNTIIAHRVLAITELQEYDKLSLTEGTD